MRETVVNVDEKACSQCRVVKSADEFYRNKANQTTGLSSACKDCLYRDKREYYKANAERLRRRSQQYRDENPELGRYIRRNSHLRRKYGISVQDYDDMLERQQGACAICEKSAEVVGKLFVDHDHATGLVRGLLCHTCNVGIGALKDSPELMLAAASYITEAQTENGIDKCS